MYYIQVFTFFRIYFSFQVLFEEEIFAMMEEIWENPQEFRYVARKGKRCNPFLGLHRILHKLFPYDAVALPTKHLF